MKNYSDKEIQIFNGVIKLVLNGLDFNELRVSKIAEASSMGKATLYEYFTSKDEIIKNTLIYCFNEQYKNLDFKELLTLKFEDKLRFILKTIYKYSNCDTTFKVMTSKISANQIKIFFKDDNELLPELKNKIVKLVDHLVTSGRNEGLVTNSDDEFLYFGIVGVLQAFNNVLIRKDYKLDQSTMDKYINYSCDAILRLCR